MAKPHTKESFIEKSKMVHGDLYVYDNVIYANCNTKVEITCSKHGSFLQRPDHHLSGHGCKTCRNEQIGRNNRTSLIKFITTSNKVHNYFYDYSRVNFKKATEKVEIICPSHGIFFQTASSHQLGHKCIKCAAKLNGKNQRRTDEKFLTQAQEIHGEIYEYDLTDYANSYSTIKIKCTKHNFNFEQRVGNHLNGKIGCTFCKVISHGENIIKKILLKNAVKFEIQKQFPEFILNSKPHKFDFYLPDLQVMIEYDGEQHFKPIERFGGQRAFERTQQADLDKNKFCFDREIKLIRIKYDQDIFLRLKEEGIILID